MKFVRLMLVFCVLAALANLTRAVSTPTVAISPIENKAYSKIGPDIKSVALLPSQLVLVTQTKHLIVSPKEIGLSIAPNMTLSINNVTFTKTLNGRGIDIAKSGPAILAAVSRSSEVIRVYAKPSAPKPTPTAIKPPTVVPDYVPPGQVAIPSTHTITYCVATRGVDSSYLPELKAKLESVYTDPRGWSLGGVNSFVPTSSDCSMTVWLTAADQMPSFGSICDSMWSCTVFPSVILNFDRWRYASPAWNGAGGSLDDYRTMVINHETGHWLGFGHRFCAGAGIPAPVMQQQSISLQGCAANPWPLQYEKGAL